MQGRVPRGSFSTGANSSPAQKFGLPAMMIPQSGVFNRPLSSEVQSARMTATYVRVQGGHFCRPPATCLLPAAWLVLAALLLNHRHFLDNCQTGPSGVEGCKQLLLRKNCAMDLSHSSKQKTLPSYSVRPSANGAVQQSNRSKSHTWMTSHSFRSFGAGGKHFGSLKKLKFHTHTQSFRAPRNHFLPCYTQLSTFSDCKPVLSQLQKQQFHPYAFLILCTSASALQKADDHALQLLSQTTKSPSPPLCLPQHSLCKWAS